MAQALGIAAFVLLLISFPVPLVGTYITFLALVIAAAAAFNGERTWAIVTVVISTIKVFLLSPTWHLAMFGAAYMQAANGALDGAGSAGSQYSDAGINNVLSAAKAGREASTNAASGANTFNLLMTVAFLALPVVAMVIRTQQAKGKPSVAVPPAPVGES